MREKGMPLLRNNLLHCLCLLSLLVALWALNALFKYPHFDCSAVPNRLPFARRWCGSKARLSYFWSHVYQVYTVYLSLWSIPSLQIFLEYTESTKVYQSLSGIPYTLVYFRIHVCSRWGRRMYIHTYVTLSSFLWMWLWNFIMNETCVCIRRIDSNRETISVF